MLKLRSLVKNLSGNIYAHIKVEGDIHSTLNYRRYFYLYNFFGWRIESHPILGLDRMCMGCVAHWPSVLCLTSNNFQIFCQFTCFHIFSLQKLAACRIFPL